MKPLKKYKNRYAIQAMLKAKISRLEHELLDAQVMYMDQDIHWERSTRKYEKIIDKKDKEISMLKRKLLEK